jgi:predicted membrane protein
MQNRNQALIGVILVLLGLGFLLANLLRISFWAICFPAGLILLGILMLTRPAGSANWHFFGNVRRGDDWQVHDEELWIFLGEAKFDFTHAQLPVGETVIRLNGFIGDVDVIAPPDIGVLVSASGFVVDLRTPTEKIDRFLSPVDVASPNYATAERKLRLITAFFVGDIDILHR